MQTNKKPTSLHSEEPDKIVNEPHIPAESKVPSKWLTDTNVSQPQPVHPGKLFCSSRSKQHLHPTAILWSGRPLRRAIALRKRMAFPVSPQTTTIRLCPPVNTGHHTVNNTKYRLLAYIFSRKPSTEWVCGDGGFLTSTKDTLRNPKCNE